MNARRRQKSLLPTSDRELPRQQTPLPSAKRQRVNKAAGSASLFADFFAAAMTLPPELLADLE